MRAVILFTRVPLKGRTKTRLMPYFNGNECAKLHSAMLKDLYNECKKTSADIFIAYTPANELNKLYQLLGCGCRYFTQTGESLGERMYNALKYVFSKNYTECVLIGSDIPELKSTYIKRAFEKLKYNELVFGKTFDGGYYLTAMKKPVREVFFNDTEADSVLYGHPKVWQDTFSRLRAFGFKIGYTKTLYDIDVKDDINAYRNRIRKNKALQESNTGKYLLKKSRISIIIPVYNEEKTIPDLLRQLKPLYGKCEIIFVDGNSSDNSRKILENEKSLIKEINGQSAYTIIDSSKGRALQMNTGAKKSTGDILFFLHCDSELPDKCLAHIRYVMKDFKAGCFGIAFHSKNFFMLTCRIISNHRIKDRKVMFGDQGIFIDRKVFFQAGMFPEIPIMEDYQFSLTLKEMGIKLGMAKKRIYTSDRRFPEGTYNKLKLMWKMNRLRKMYRDGVDINIISRLYRDKR